MSIDQAPGGQQNYDRQGNVLSPRTMGVLLAFGGLVGGGAAVAGEIHYNNNDRATVERHEACRDTVIRLGDNALVRLDQLSPDEQRACLGKDVSGRTASSAEAMLDSAPEGLGNPSPNELGAELINVRLEGQARLPKLESLDRVIAQKRENAKDIRLGPVAIAGGFSAAAFPVVGFMLADMEIVGRPRRSAGLQGARVDLKKAEPLE